MIKLIFIKKMYIYLITNLITNKKYVGQTVTTIDKRYKRHYQKYSKNSKYRSYIYNSMMKYGKENFIVEELDRANTIEELNEKEIFWIKKLNTLYPNGYNLNTGGNNYRHTEETKRKISESNKGKKVSEKTIEKLRKSHLGNVHSEESKQKLRIANLGKKQTIDHINKRVNKISKKYNLISPDGHKINVHNMAEFCRKNNLSRSKMSLVTQGKRNHHKGWKLNN